MKRSRNKLSPISIEDMKQTVKKMKNRKAPGINSVTAEVLKAGRRPMTEMRHEIFNAIWVHEKTPKDSTRILVTTMNKKGDKRMTLETKGGKLREPIWLQTHTI